MYSPNWNQSNTCFILDISHTCQVNISLKTLKSEETGSPVFHEPEVLSIGCTVAHNQDGMIYELWVAVWYIVQT